MRLAVQSGTRAPGDEPTTLDVAERAPSRAERRLIALLDAPPPLDAGAAFYLAQVRERAGLEAAPLYERAARAFAAAGVYDGVYWSRLNLGRLARQAERWRRAVTELDVAREAATRTGDAQQIAGAELETLRLRLRAGNDLRALEADFVALLERLESDPALGTTRRAPIRNRALSALADVRFRLGRYTAASATWRRLADLQDEQGDAYGRATTALNLALPHLTFWALETRDDPVARAVPALQQALDLAREAGNRPAEAMASTLLAQLEGESRPSIDPDRLYARALELADPALMPVQRRQVLSALAAERASLDPGSARRHVEEASALGESDRSLAAADAYLWEAQLRVAWASLPSAAAIDASMPSLDAVEALRARQLARGGRGDYFAVWTEAHNTLAGLLFETASRAPANDGPLELGRLDGAEAPPRAVERALARPEIVAPLFEVLERRRARLLLDTTAEAIDLAPATAVSSDELVRELLEDRPADDTPQQPEDSEATLERLGAAQADLHRRLLAADLDVSARTEIEAQLDRLEAREDAVWRQLEAARRADDEHPPAAVPVADLAAVRSALRPDEAMLVVLSALRRGVFGRFAGGSWLLVLTRDSEHLVELPDPRRVGVAIDTVSGLLESGDAAAPALTALAELTIAPTLAALPPSIEHLIVLADGPYHRLPLAALPFTPKSRALRSRTAPPHANPSAATNAGETVDKAAPPEAARSGTPAAARDDEATTVGQRFTVSRPPSATLWLRWRQRAAAPSDAPALVIADPAFVLDATVDGRRLERLPGAAAEARSVRRHLGRGTEVLVADAADERALRARDLPRFAVLHVAAHALLDTRRARRSGLVLAPSGVDDGLLRPPEITRLRLDDRLVVLTACHGAAGRLLRGEGPQSLARAFFESGARAVVAGLWRLRDDDAEHFTDRFYAALASGQSVATAARTARRDLAAQGVPADAWSGLVVLGDGTHVPFPHPADTPSRLRLVLIALAVLLVVGVLALVALRRRRSSPS